VHSETIRFEVEGVDVVADLYLPDGAGPFPGLVFEGPLTSVRGQVTGNYARLMAERGFAGLSLDHRHFGESGGEPRQYEHPGRKVEDLRAGLDVMAARPDVDGRRLGAVGVCAGAGYMARLVATEPRIRAWGTVAGFFHDVHKQREWMGEEAFKGALERAVVARRTYEATGVVETIHAVGREGEEVAMPLAEAFNYYGTPRGQVPGYVNAFARMSREHTLPWDAQGAAPEIAQPTLLIHSERALAPSLARAFFAALAGPKEAVWMESDGQIDFYDDPRRTVPAATRLAAHFEAHLARGEGTT
jgi:uncharacterized protein